MVPQKQPISVSRSATLTIPELQQSKTAVLNTLASVHSRRSYAYAIERFIAWYCSEPSLTFNRSVVVRYRSFLERLSLSAATINLHLSAIRRWLFLFLGARSRSVRAACRALRRNDQAAVGRAGSTLKKASVVAGFEGGSCWTLLLHFVLFRGVFHLCFSHFDGYCVNCVFRSIHMGGKGYLVPFMAL